MVRQSEPIRPTPTCSPSPRAVALAGLAALAIAMGIGRFAFTPILPMMQQDAGLSVADGGWLASANYFGYLLGAMSAMAFRPRPALAIRTALVVIGIGTLGMGLERRFAAWVVLRVLAGVGSAWVLVFASAWCLARLAPVQRPFLNGAVFAGVGTGITIAGGLCRGLMQANASSAQAWGDLGVIALAGTAAIWHVFGADDVPGSDEGASSAARRRFWDADSLRLVLCYGAFGFGYIIPGTFLPVMARQVAHDPSVFGWSWPIFGVAAATSTLAAAVWTRRVGNRRLWILGHLVMAFGVALPVSWPAIGGIVIAALLVGGTFMVITLAGMQEARAVAGPQATRLMAGMTAAFGTGQIAGPMLAGSMVGADANFSRPLLIACLILVASACALYPWRGRNGIAREEVGNGSSQKGDGEHPRRH
ncbi:MAG: MFS transporter [Candidatus Rokuibacteriota bacterium]|nr:MAG: MFS transporter [Candidatus Rokubacteria bacterium]